MSTLNIQKKIVTDDLKQPIAVQIDYQNWLKIEQKLNLVTTPIQKKPLRSLKSFRSSLSNKVKTPSVDLIRQMRDEGY